MADDLRQRHAMIHDGALPRGLHEQNFRTVGGGLDRLGQPQQIFSLMADEFRGCLCGMTPDNPSAGQILGESHCRAAAPRLRDFLAEWQVNQKPAGQRHVAGQLRLLALPGVRFNLQSRPIACVRIGPGIRPIAFLLFPPRHDGRFLPRQQARHLGANNRPGQIGRGGFSGIEIRNDIFILDGRA